MQPVGTAEREGTRAAGGRAARRLPRPGRRTRPAGTARAGARQRADNRAGWALAAPAVLLLAVMTVAVAIYVIYESLYRTGSFGTGNVFVGLGNYAAAFTANNFTPDLIRTLGYVAVSVVIELAAGVALGLVLARPARSNRVAAALFVIPFACTPAASALVARVLLDPNYGWVDYYLHAAGLASTPIQWLSHPVTAWIALIGLDVWEWTPFVALIVMAGAQSLPGDVFDAAAVDGAGPWARFRHIQLPMLTPFIAIAGVLRVIQAFKTFDIFQILTNGGPGSSTEVVNLSLYRIVMQDFSIGSGAAIAVMLLVILLLLTPLLLRTVGRHADPERSA
jgi:multiple sugar transport system permease protein